MYGTAFALLAVLMASQVSVAAATGTSGLSLGLRSGYGVPKGSTAQGQDLSQNRVKGMIPVWVDIGYRLSSSLYLGAFLQYGLGYSPNICGGGLDCSVNDLRFGVNAHYHLLPTALFDPWVGLGIGYEVLNQSISGNVVGTPVSASSHLSGFEFVNLQVGGDFRLSSNLSLGPFVAFTVDQFSRGSVSADGTGSNPLDLTNKAIHDWLIAGVRGVFDLSL